jgi:hypothetical protein
LVTTSSYTEQQDFAGATLVVDQLGEPGDPATATVGDLGGAEYIDLALLRRLRNQVFG